MTVYRGGKPIDPETQRTLPHFRDNDSNSGRGQVPADEAPEVLVYYDHLTQEITGTQEEKADEFLKEDCLRRVDQDEWECGPIEGYNQRTYTVQRKSSRSWECNCQWYTMHEATCSHILAVLKSLKRRV